ncbi:MAG: metal-binding protein [Clostridiales bacterium]|nr:metal-binding protein [Clostridiales bacterium]
MSNETKIYKLIGEDGKEYLSPEKGTLGGHRKQKLYGRLDCPSALRALKRHTGHVYASNRVFFADEKTALAAGYRPCSRCMKEHYDLWKDGKLHIE